MRNRICRLHRIVLPGCPARVSAGFERPALSPMGRSREP
ncbi:unnamed protein product [Ciceribacter sp. T2.26MG-112.2]|nr:unnamed protein product [Ciceribacter naphthalenivorans]